MKKKCVAAAISNNTRYNVLATIQPSDPLPFLQTWRGGRGRKKKKKDPRNRWISRISNPLPFNFPPRVFSSISTRLSDRHLNRNRSVKRWYACNASRVLPSTSRLRNDYSSKSSFQSDSATPNTIRLVLDTFSTILPTIYMCIGTKEEKEEERSRWKTSW